MPQSRKTHGRYRSNGADPKEVARTAAAGRAFVISLLSAEEKRLKGSAREAVICGRLAIHYANEGLEGKARTFAMLAVRSAKLAERLAALQGVPD